MTTDNPTTPAAGTRERLIAAMLDALPRKGYHGVGLTELLAVAQAPKGVLYHHFPGGKAELAVAAIELVVEQLLAGLDKLAARNADPVAALGSWMATAQQRLSSSQFERGCPLATIALESTPDDVGIRQALATGFARIRDRLAATLVAAGMDVPAARDMAALVVSAYEGALLQARVAGRTDSMQHTSQALLLLLQRSLQANSPADTPPQDAA